MGVLDEQLRYLFQLQKRVCPSRRGGVLDVLPGTVRDCLGGRDDGERGKSMMLETVNTNGVAIIAMILLWVGVTWTITYIYMSEKISNLNYTIRVLDEYIVTLEERI
jgi:hypothetical protein